MNAVTVRHRFEAAHRLPHLAGKCTSLHGHSWSMEVTVSAQDLSSGTVVEFAALKRGLREWVDTHLDHGTMLGATDPLAPVLADHGKVFRFGAADPNPGESAASALPWPTVEHVAELLAHVAAAHLADIPRAAGAAVTRVRVTETAVNAAEWRLW